MKLTVAVVLCTLAVLQLQMETPLAQYCSDPECSSGALFDRYACQCSSFAKSTCPDGTSPIVNPNGQCSCQEVVHPKCYEGYTLNPDDCVCKTSVVPDCPKNTYLWPRNARCVGTDDPYCPKGFTKVGCKCVRDDERVCESGKLTANYCKCKNVYPPTCTGDGCSLNTNGQCTCERDDPHRIQCYYGRRCSGQARYVSSEDECCYHYPDNYDGDESAAPPYTRQYLRPYTYRNQQGQCYSCYYYYYYGRHHG